VHPEGKSAPPRTNIFVYFGALWGILYSLGIIGRQVSDQNTVHPRRKKILAVPMLSGG